MILVSGTWMPDGAKSATAAHKPSVRAREIDAAGQYRPARLRRAIAHCRQRRMAIDVGAHVGTWSKIMAAEFKEVVAFEPLPEHVACFRQNVTEPHVQLMAMAVGDHDGMTKLKAARDMSVRVGIDVGFMPSEIVQLDSFGFEHVDFLKIDVEGYEMAVLAGARDLLERWHPVVIVEQKPSCTTAYGYKPTEAIDYLCEMGARYLWAETIDHCLAWTR